MKVLCLLVMIFMPTITCYGQQHYENCDIIKKQDYDITVAVIEYMPEPFDETLAPKDYMLSNLNRLKDFVVGVATEVEARRADAISVYILYYFYFPVPLVRVPAPLPSSLTQRERKRNITIYTR